MGFCPRRLDRAGHPRILKYASEFQPTLGVKNIITLGSIGDRSEFCGGHQRGAHNRESFEGTRLRLVLSDVGILYAGGVGEPEVVETSRDQLETRSQSDLGAITRV